MTPQDMAATAALRKRLDKRCLQCGEPMPNALKIAKYCTNRCRQRAKYARSKLA